MAAQSASSSAALSSTARSFCMAARGLPGDAEIQILGDLSLGDCIDID
jgi:hypothetical protein